MSLLAEKARSRSRRPFCANTPRAQAHKMMATMKSRFPCPTYPPITFPNVDRTSAMVARPQRGLYNEPDAERGTPRSICASAGLSDLGAAAVRLGQRRLAAAADHSGSSHLRRRGFAAVGRAFTVRTDAARPA